MILRLLSKAHFYNILLLLVFHFSCVKTRSYNFKLVIITGSSGRSSRVFVVSFLSWKPFVNVSVANYSFDVAEIIVRRIRFLSHIETREQNVAIFFWTKLGIRTVLYVVLEVHNTTIQCRERTVDKNVFRPCRTNQMPKRNSIGIFMLAIHIKPIEIGRCRFHEKKVRKDL